MQTEQPKTAQITVFVDNKATSGLRFLIGVSLVQPQIGKSHHTLDDYLTSTSSEGAQAQLGEMCHRRKRHKSHLLALHSRFSRSPFLEKNFKCLGGDRHL
jgi:hypothetical protein